MPTNKTRAGPAYCRSITTTLVKGPLSFLPLVVTDPCLDLFAGTGAVGIEALSRGAARVVLVERDQSALRALRANLAALGASRAAARVMAGDVLLVLPELGAQEEPFDFVFVDPPYATTLAGRTLEALAAARICRDGAEVVVQHSTRTVLPAVRGLTAHRRPRQFGDTALTFLRAEEYTPDGSRP